jgi:hypothetical protein
MPAAAGVYSLAEYNIAKQILSEDVGGWHARLCNLYNWAYPGQEVDNNLPLIKKFVTQLIHKEVGNSCSKGTQELLQGPLRLPKTRRLLTRLLNQLCEALAFILSPTRPKMASTTQVKDAAAEAMDTERAETDLKEEKEKRASAGFATPPPISASSARCGLKQWRLSRRKRAVAPPQPTNGR